MKYLSDFNDKMINNVLKTNGAFFAFSNKQFEENKKEGVMYCKLYGGMIAPKENVKTILKGLEEAQKKGIKEDMKEHTIKQIVFRDCANFELQFSYDGLNEIKEALNDYPINAKDIEKHYNDFIKHCIKNDLY